MLDRISSIVLLAAFLPTLASAQVPSIYIDIGSPSAASGVPTSALAAAAPFPGVWNAFDGDAAGGSTFYATPPLVDTSGVITPVTMEMDGLGRAIGTLNANNPLTTGDDEALIDDIVWIDGNYEVTFRGLPPGFYDVYTYGMAPDSANFGTRVRVPGATTGLQNVGGDFSQGYVQGTTHAYHTIDLAPGAALTIELGSFNSSLNGVQIVPAEDPIEPGAYYCGPAATNSVGLSAETRAAGSTFVANNNLTLNCSSMPVGSFGFFLVSEFPGFTSMPGGSAGNLCLSGSIGRYVGSGQVQTSGPAGTFSLAIDLAFIPQPLGPVVGAPGQTWHFQAWYRDVVAGVASSNFSDGYRIILR